MKEFGSRRSWPLATTVVREGKRGAETRHLAMVERLGELGFDVRVEVCDIRPSARGALRWVVLRKFFAGIRTAREAVAKQESFFAFEPYSFIGGALFMRLGGGEALFFCRNDQVYEFREIARQMNQAPRISWRLYALQFLCLVLCTTYVVQSNFAARNLAQRFKRWPLSDSAKKIKILRNDLRIPVSKIRSPDQREQLRVGFISNPGWERKGFFVLRDLLVSDAFKQAELSFTIIGKGEAFDRLRGDVAELSDSKVDFYGLCQDIEELREVVDVTFVPSIVDHFPNVVLECAALGLPMVLSDIEAHRNILPEHPGYFDLSADPQEVIDMLLSFRDPAIWTATAESQQRDILLLTNAWQEPLAEVFEPNAKVR